MNGAWRSAGRSVPAGTRRLVHTLDAVHPGNFPDIRENGLELAAVGDFQAGFDPRVELVRSAFQVADVRAGAADHRGNFRQQAGAVLGANRELHRESRGALSAPFRGDAAVRLIEKIL